MRARFGLSTHLFHDDRLDERHLHAIAAHGFDLVELFATATHFDYRDAGRVREMGRWLQEAGLEAGSMHGPIFDGFRGGEWGRALSNASADPTARQEAIDHTRAALAAAHALGCRTLVLHLGLPLGQKVPRGDNDPSALRRSLDALGPAAREAGVRLALELIPNPLSTPAELLRWMDDEAGLEDGGVCFDVGHAHMMGGAPEAVEVLSGHIITTHVHDNNGREDAHLVPFAGSIDWPATLTAMWKVGYAGPLVFEVADHGDGPGVLARTVGARGRLQAILDDLAQPFAFE